MIVTGGRDTEYTVSVYGIDGWMEDLPDLRSGRFYHGCGHYINDENKMVL